MPDWTNMDSYGFPVLSKTHYITCSTSRSGFFRPLKHPEAFENIYEHLSSLLYFWGYAFENIYVHLTSPQICQLFVKGYISHDISYLFQRILSVDFCAFPLTNYARLSECCFVNFGLSEKFFSEYHFRKRH